MHAEALEFVREQAAAHGPFDHVVEIGSRNINGSVRPEFTHADTYVGIDLIDGPGVDVVLNAENFEPDEPADCVVAAEVFEHYEDWPSLVESGFGWLQPGGVMIATAAYTGRVPHSGMDGSGQLKDGEHYENLTKKAVADAFNGAGFGAVDIRVRDRDIYVTAIR